MKIDVVLQLYISLVENKQRLYKSYLLEYYNITERTMYNYLGNINEIIRIEKGLEIRVKDGIVQCIIFE